MMLRKTLCLAALLLFVVLTPCFAEGSGEPQKNRFDVSSKIDWTKAGARISEAKAKRLTRNFTEERDGVRGHMYAADKVRKLIDQEGAVALRLHFARYDQEPALVLMGVAEGGHDLKDGIILDWSKDCPPDCSEVLAPLPSLKAVRSAGAFISLEDAEQMTQGFTQKSGGVRAFTFSAKLIRGVLDHDGVEAVRFYLGKSDKARPTLVGVGVNGKGLDIPATFFDFGKNCPPFCG